MGKKTIKKYIETYIKRLKDVNPEKVIVYGSYLTDSFKLGESDIDLLIIAKSFENLDEDDRLRILYRKTTGLPLDFHLYGCTPQEIKNVSPLQSIYYALKTGKQIS